MSIPESNWNQLFETLRDSRLRIALVVTGGGSGAVRHCFRREGASRNFIEGVIPYSHAALSDYLGGPPADSSASASVVKQLASVALERAARLSDETAEPPGQPAGIALVAALPTTPRRRGSDRIHVAMLTQESTQSQTLGTIWSLKLAKDAFSREQAESIADEMIRLAICQLIAGEVDDSLLRAAGLELTSSRFQD